MGSGSLDRALASLVPPSMSMSARMTNDAATLVCLNMRTPPLGKRKAHSNDRTSPEYQSDCGRKYAVRLAIRYLAQHQIKHDLVVPLDEGVGVLTLPIFSPSLGASVVELRFFRTL